MQATPKDAALAVLRVGLAGRVGPEAQLFARHILSTGQDVSGLSPSGAGAKRLGANIPHFGCALTRASRRMWCLAAHDLARGHAHPAPPTPCGAARSEKTQPKWGSIGRRPALQAGLHPSNLVARQAVGQYRGVLAANCQRASAVNSGAIQRSRALRRCAGRWCGTENKKARILVRSGPLRTERGGCASTRFPLPGAPGPRPDQAVDSPRVGSDAVQPCNRRTASSLRRARTRPGP